MSRQIQQTPTIVYGPLRSGTTVFRLMLDAHPQISNPGEFDYLFTYARVGEHGIEYDREGMKGGFLFQDSGLRMEEGLSDEELFESFIAQLQARKRGVLTLNVHHRIRDVRRLLPDARFIHLIRDPRDVAKSCMEMGWAGSMYHAVDHWIHVERSWDLLKADLDEAQFIEIRFEDLLCDPETVLRRVCAFLGVDYDPAMLSYPDGSTYAAPDASMAYKWRKRMKQSDVRLASLKAQDIIRARGYEVPENLDSPNLLERLSLRARNKLGIWAFGVRRHGPWLYFAEKLARRGGPSSVNAIIRERINATSRLVIK